MKARALVMAFLLLAIIAILAVTSGAFATTDAPLPPTSPPPNASGLGGGADGDRPAAKAQREVVADGVADASVVTCRVRVEVVLPNGDPAVGAEVHYWPSRNAAQRASDAAAREATGDLEQALVATGRRVVADARGLVDVEVEADAELCARLGSLYGELSVGLADIDESPLRLCLQPDFAMQVAVVDSQSNPCAGVTVRISSELFTRRQGYEERSWALQTAAQGVARVPHLPSYLGLQEDVVEGRLRFEIVRERDGDEPDSRVVLAALEVDWARLSQDGRVRLVVPPGGTIVVRVTNPEGSNLAAFPSLLDERGVVFAFAEDDAEGGAFRLVPLHRSWSVRIEYGGTERVVAVGGPTRPGEVVRVDVPWTRHLWCFRGRVVRGDGQPFDDQIYMKLFARCPSIAPQATELHCKMGAPFELCVESELVAEQLLELRVDPAWHSLSEAKTFRFERDMPPGVIELGDLALPWAADVVTLATIEVRCGGRGITRAASLRLDDANGMVRTMFTHRGNVREFWGRPPTSPIRLSCHHPDCLPLTHIPLQLGEQRVVEMQRAAALRIAILPPEVPDVRGVLDRLDAEDAAETWHEAGRPTLDWGNLPPGRYRLRIEVADVSLYEAAELTLAPGANRWPVDGSSLDLRGKAKALRVMARAADDKASMVEVSVFELPAGATTLPSEDDRSEQAGWFLLRPEPRDLLVRAHDYVPVRVRAPTSDVSLRMQRMTKLALTCADAAKLADVRVTIVRDAVLDPLLQAFDDDEHQHALEQRYRYPDPDDLRFAPGTELEIATVRDGKPGPVQKVVVGERSPQKVELR